MQYFTRHQSARTPSFRVTLQDVVEAVPDILLIAPCGYGAQQARENSERGGCHLDGDTRSKIKNSTYRRWNYRALNSRWSDLVLFPSASDKIGNYYTKHFCVARFSAGNCAREKHRRASV